MRRPWVREMAPGIVLSVALSFFAALYGPLELFVTNTGEFGFDLWLLLPALGKLFLLLLVFCLFGFALCRVIYVRLYELALAGASWGLLCAVVQGLFLAGGLPPLDGTPINWVEYRGQSLISIAVWMILGLAITLLIRFLGMKRMRRAFTGGAIFLTAVLLVTLTSVTIIQKGYESKPHLAVTKAEEFTMSQDQNLVIFVLDAMDSLTYVKLLSADQTLALEDFTYYPNTVSAYTFTYYAIPQILHGQWYEHQEPFPQFTAKAMYHSPLFRNLHDRDYRIGIYETDLLRYNNAQESAHAENVVDTKVEFISLRTLWKQEMKLVWFKYAPFPLKRMFRVQIGAFSENLMLSNQEELFLEYNREFYDDLQASEIRIAPEKCFRFIHIEGAHVPFRYDKHVNLIDEAQGSYEQNQEASITVFKAYLEKLKAAGVYDNTAIIVMGDHGYGINWDNGLLGRVCPLLAVKGVGESHPMLVNHAPISYEDLQTAYERLLEGKSSEEVFDAKEGDDRERRVLVYLYGREEHMEEYIQTGHAFDLTTMKPTGVVYDAK